MLEFAILARGFFRADQLHIAYDAALRMPADAATRAWMDTLWAEKLVQAGQRNVPLYDAPLFRLIAARSEGEYLALTLGDTSYKEYVTTREPIFAERHTRQELGNALGVCSVVETSDGHILLDKREGVDVYEGRYHVIGGFFERELDGDVEGGPDPFAAVLREIHEETGILAEDIATQRCFGAVYDLLTPHGELCFFTQLHIPLATVLTRTPLDHEIKNLNTLTASAEKLEAFIRSNHRNISTTGEANLLMYGGWRFGEAWLSRLLEWIGA